MGFLRKRNTLLHWEQQMRFCGFRILSFFNYWLFFLFFNCNFLLNGSLSAVLEAAESTLNHNI